MVAIQWVVVFVSVPFYMPLCLRLAIVNSSSTKLLSVIAHADLDTGVVPLGSHIMITFIVNAPIAKRDFTYLVSKVECLCMCAAEWHA